LLVLSGFANRIRTSVSIKEAAVLSNTAACIVVGKLGTATLTTEELINGLKLSSRAYHLLS